MSGRTETNVRLPPRAFDALAAVAARRGPLGTRRSADCWAEHVGLQEQRGAGDRLTHISTVLRYPPPPRCRIDPRTDRPLRLRVPVELLKRARAVSLRLPGQYQRGYRNYQGRILTDAVMTPIVGDRCRSPAIGAGLGD